MAAACLAVLASALALLGWCLDDALLKSLLPGAVQMKANTAVALLLAGGALALRARPGEQGQALATAFGLAVALIGGATFFQYLAGVRLGIDELLFRDFAHAYNAIPGRMSPFTACALLLLGVALALARQPWGRWVAWACAVQVALLGALCVLGYGWNASELVTDSWLPPVALNTAIVLTALGVGVLQLQRPASRSTSRWASLEERNLTLSFWALVLVLMAAMGYTYRSNLRFVDATRSLDEPQSVRLALAQLHACALQVQASGDTPRRCASLLATLQQQLARTPDQAAHVKELARALAAGRSIAPLVAEMDRVEMARETQGQLALDGESTKVLVSLIVTLLLSSTIFAWLTRRMRGQVRRSHAAREQIEAQQTLLAAVVDSSPDLIVYKDLQGTYLGCNRAYAEMRGMAPEQIVGRKARDLFEAAVAESIERSDRQVLGTAVQSSEERAMVAPDGRTVMVDVVRSPLLDHEGVPGGVLAVGRNITARKEVEEQLRRAQALAEEAGAAKTAFLASMSHEIRTPMTGVLGMIDLLAAENLAPHQRQYVESMRASGRHLLHVINDILDYSRIEAGRLELEHIAFSVPQLTERLRSLLHPLASERGLALRLELAPRVPEVVVGDPTRVQQVLLNLASNAIKFTPAGSVDVAVSATDDEAGGARLSFRVRDTGVGIAADKLQQLFAPFTQADRSTARHYGGSGLGLAISKRLAEAMGGRILASSEPGAGSVFTLDLPLEIAQGEVVPTQPAALSGPAPRRRILVAEDNQINRDILQAALARHGHELVFATTGGEALAQVQEREFDLVLMDVQMPGMDGVEATRRIRRLPLPAGGLPIIALTANVMAAEQQKYLQAGMDECLMKPIEWDRLFAAIARHGGTGTTAAPHPEPEAPPPMEVPALLDEARMEQLGAMAGREGLMMIVASAIDAASTGSARMREIVSLAELAVEGHKLKGSCATVGLATLAHTASGIEIAASAGSRPTELLDMLPAQVDATRAALRARGLVLA